jgi:hypothetical protein
MHLALEYGADRIWVVNVGDLKPMEFPIEYFLTLGRDADQWAREDGKDKTVAFTKLWAEREFGAEHAGEIAEIVTRYAQYAGRRKPELLEPQTYSLNNYSEAERVEAQWKALEARALTVKAALPADAQDAYFELVLHPILALSNLTKMYIAAGRNRLYAEEGRASANLWAEKTRELFARDAAISREYNHDLAGGKWDHMMDQTHIGYTYWQQPPVNAMPAVSEVQPLPEPTMGVASEGAGVYHQLAPFDPRLHFNSFSRGTHWIDVFNRGTGTFRFEAKGSEPWIELSETTGSVESETRLTVSVDWDKLGNRDRASGTVSIEQLDAQGKPAGPASVVPIEAVAPANPSRTAFAGFVEGDGVIAAEAEHYSRASAANGTHWERIPEYGATLSGMTPLPVTASSVPEGPRATLEYDIYLFQPDSYRLDLVVGPSLNFQPGKQLRLAVSLDDGPPQIVTVVPAELDRDLLPTGWAQSVRDSVRHVSATVNVSAAGRHTLKVGMVDPGVVLERFVLSKQPPPPSYLGPPESFRAAAK